MQKEPQRTPVGLNTQVYLLEDRVRVSRELVGPEITGTVVGIAARELIDIYIVLLDKPLASCPWRAVVIPSTELERILPNDDNSNNNDNKENKLLSLPPRDIMYELIKERSEELLGKSENPKYEDDGSGCMHGNPRGHCFDCEG